MYQIIKHVHNAGNKLPDHELPFEDEYETHEDAVVMAELYAEEHAKRIDVPVKKLHGGRFEFVTNNGSTVTYFARKIWN